MTQRKSSCFVCSSIRFVVIISTDQLSRLSSDDLLIQNDSLRERWDLRHQGGVEKGMEIEGEPIKNPRCHDVDQSAFKKKNNVLNLYVRTHRLYCT